MIHAMARRPLKRVIRGAKPLIETTAGPFGGVRIEAPDGTVLFDSGPSGAIRHAVTVGEDSWGVVIGSEGAGFVAALLSHLAAADRERRALADETLGRYKELTLVYGLSDKLSRSLDVDSVAQLICDEATRSLGATGAALLLRDDAGTLTVQASAGELSGEPERDAVVLDVLSRAQAKFVDTSMGAVMGAPLRSGETAYGVLYLRSDEPGRWTAGDLKLVTAIASHAGAAVRHATLQTDRLRQQARRASVQRHVDPRVLRAAAGESDTLLPTVLVFCDLGELRPADASESDVGGVADLVAAEVTRALMLAGATVHLPGHDVAVGVLVAPDAPPADAAVDAAIAIQRSLDVRHGGPLAFAPAVAIVGAELVGSRDTSGFAALLGRAVSMHGTALGRVLIGAELGGALAGRDDVFPAHAASGGVSQHAYEVRA
jgi:hypothetical protein